MPGEGLYQLPNISMEVGGATDEEEVRGRHHGSSHQDLEEEELKSMSPSKRAKLMADVRVVPSGEVKRNSGGRGKERYRARKSGTLCMYMYMDKFVKCARGFLCLWV